MVDPEPPQNRSKHAKEARLAQALRANLRRRKAGRAAPSPTDKPNASSPMEDTDPAKK